MADSKYDSDDLLTGMHTESAHSGTSDEEIQRQKQVKEQKLLEIRRMQEQLERESRELEDFTTRKDEMTRNLQDIMVRLQRSLVILEREEFESQKKTEEIRRTRQIFEQHVQELTPVEAVTWHSLEQRRDLTKAMTLVENARGDFNQAEARLSVLTDLENEDGSPLESISNTQFSFMSAVVQGFAQNLGLIIAILILAAAILMKS